MVYLIGLWANVLPGLLLLLLVWRVAERFEPGYGAAAAVALGLGTMVLPLSTLLFSHVFTAFLGFAAFALMLRERDGPPQPDAAGARRPGDGLRGRLGVPAVLRRRSCSACTCSRAATRCTPLRRAAPRRRLHRAAASSGIVPLLLYNHYAFHSWTHLAYSDVPRQQKGFFGIGAPSLKVLATLLFDSRGLLTISPVLIMGAIGTVLLYRRGRRAEALTIGGICLCYVGYNSGYYLPFGGGFMGPRFLTTMLPFLAFPLALAFKRFPGPDDRAGGGLDHDDGDRHDHPPARRLRERDGRLGALPARGLLPADDRLRLRARARLGRDLAVPARRRRRACVLAAWATPRLRLSAAALGAGVLALRGLGAVRGARADAAGHRPPGPAEHLGAGDHTALQPEAARRHQLSADDARADRGRRRAARAGRDAPAAQRAASDRPAPARRRPSARSQPAPGRARSARPPVLGDLDVALRAVQLLHTTT